MAPCGFSWLSVGYISAVESWCPPFKIQPQHSSVYLISVFVCSLKLPRRRKGFVMWTMCDCWRRWERLKQQGTQRVWLHLPVCLTLHLMSDLRLTVCKMISASRRPLRPKMRTDTRDKCVSNLWPSRFQDSKLTFCYKSSGAHHFMLHSLTLFSVL